MTQTTPSEDVIDKIDEALKDDNFETRQGLRFMATVLKGAMRVIGKEEQSKVSINTRLQNMETGLAEFLEKESRKDKKAEEERTKWRWIIITPIVGMILSEIFRWILR